MAVLTLDEKTARKLYPTAVPDFKSILEETFGKSFFSEKITDRIKTFEDACEAIDEDPENDRFIIGTPDDIAYQKMKVIVRALNQGWVPDWNNNSQYKWWPWFYLNSPGFRFYGSRYDFSGTHTSGGSRLCFSSRELSDYAAKQFLNIYKDLIS